MKRSSLRTVKTTSPQSLTSLAQVSIHIDDTWIEFPLFNADDSEMKCVHINAASIALLCYLRQDCSIFFSDVLQNIKLPHHVDGQVTLQGISTHMKKASTGFIDLENLRVDDILPGRSIMTDFLSSMGIDAESFSLSLQLLSEVKDGFLFLWFCFRK